MRRIFEGSIIGLFILILFFLPIQVTANTVEIETKQLLPQDTKSNISEFLYIIEDKEKKWTIDDVVNGDASKEFVRNTKDIPNFGYTSSAYWAHFKLKNNTEATERLMEIGYSPLNEINVYVFDEFEMVDELQMGAKYPFFQRPFIHPNFLRIFEIEKGETLSFYIRFETEGSMQMPITIWEQSGFVSKRQSQFLLLGIFYGITGVMAFYNLFLYFSLRHRSYLYYVLVISMMSLVNLSLNGIAYQYLWPESPWWNTRSIVFFISVGGVFSLLFANSFLDLKRYLPKAKNMLRVLIGLNAFIAILVLFSYKYALNLMVPGMTSMIIFVLLSAYLCWKKGARQARFFIVGWFIFLIGVLFSILADSAFLPLNIVTRNIWQVSATLEMIILSLALADRINILQDEKNQAVLIAHENQLLAVENLKRSDELKGEFLAVTSHELRTPLYGMIGIAESLKAGAVGKVSSVMESHLELIIASGERLTRLVNDLLDLSKLKHGAMKIQLQSVDLKQVIDVIIPVCKPLVKDKKLAITNNVSKEFPSIPADQNRLMQVLYNLIGNAIKFTHSGEIVISAGQTDEGYLVSVADTGKGMTESEMTTIFEPFWQEEDSLSREFDGTGIGLNITKQLVELHEGSLHVESTIGKGSVFSFTLPYRKELVQLTEGRPIIDETMYGKKEYSVLKTTAPVDSGKVNHGKILVADDERVNLQVLLNQLSMEGYEVIAVSDGEGVIKAVHEQQVDLVILDIMMPNMSGYEVCSKLRESFTLTELPILMLTAKNQLKDKLASFNAGANDYLTKPCDKEELLSRVKTLITFRKMTKELNLLNESLEQKVKVRTEELETTNLKLSIAYADLQQMEETRSQLFTSITHELRTPLTLIQNYFQAVNEGLIKENDSYYLLMIHNKLLVLERLAGDLFELAKLKTGQMGFDFEVVPVHDWWKQLVPIIKTDVEQNGRTFIHPNGIPKEIGFDQALLIDQNRMDQVFTNVIWNAIKHTQDDDGTIEIRLDVYEDTSNLDKQEEAAIIIQIIDNGLGIAKDDLPYVFERYFKVKVDSNQQSKGSGLGLAIVKEIIESHNGHVWIESVLNEGSHLFIVLPLLKPSIIKKEKV